MSGTTYLEKMPAGTEPLVGDIITADGKLFIVTSDERICMAYEVPGYWSANTAYLLEKGATHYRLSVRSATEEERV